MKHGIALFAMTAVVALAACSKPVATDTGTDPVVVTPSAGSPEKVEPLPEPVPEPVPEPTPPSVADEVPIISNYIARGNEPFWAIEVDGSTLTWKTPENQAGKKLEARRVAHANGVNFLGKDGASDFGLDINGKPCVDSMSGQEFEFTASWTYAGETNSGCAQRN